MFGNQEQMRRIMSQEMLKPKNLGETLVRFGNYFKPYWYMLVLAMFLVITSTWMQVTSPEIIGQIVDCYLTPASGSSLNNLPGAQTQTSNATSNCWLSAETQR